MIKKAINKYNSLPIQVKASLWFLLCNFMQKGINIITTPIITRLLTTEEYGQYSVFNSWLGIIGVFVSLRIGWGVYTQGLIKFENERSRFSSSLQGLTFVLALIWTVVYLLFRDFWNSLLSLTTVQMLAMLVMIWATAAYDFWAAEQRVMLKYKALVVVTLASSVLKPLVGIVFILLAENKVTAYILALALVEVVAFTGLFAVQLKRGKAFFDKGYWKYALSLCIPLAPHYLSQTLLNSSDRIMIEQLCGSGEAGIYSLAYSLSMIMTLVNNAVANTVNPWIYQKIKDKKTADIGGISYICLALIACANLVLIVFAPEAVRIFAPAKYYEAIWVIPPVAMSVYFMFAYGLFADFEFYYEKTSFISAATIAGAVLNIVLNYLCIEKFGYIAAGYTTLVCYILYAVGHYYFMTRLCREYLNGEKPYNLKLLLSMTAVFLTTGFAVMFTYNYPVIRYCLATAAVIAAIVFRKRIIGALKSVLSLRKERAENK